MKARKIPPILFSAFFLVAWFRPASAQVTNPRDCAEALRWAGISWENKSDIEKIDSAVNYFCSKRFSSSSEARSLMTQAGFVVEAIPMNFGLDVKDDKFQQDQAELCASEDRYTRARTQTQTVIKGLDQNVTKGVADCMKSQSGLLAFLEQTADPKRIRVSLRLIDSSKARIDEFVVAPNSIKCSGTLKGIVTGGSAPEVICTRDPNEAVTISLSSKSATPKWVTASSLPAVMTWPPPVTKFCEQGEVRHLEYADTGGDRLSRFVQCPQGMVMKDPGVCSRSVPDGTLGSLKEARTIGENTAFQCFWDRYQEVGIVLKAEIWCTCK